MACQSGYNNYGAKAGTSRRNSFGDHHSGVAIIGMPNPGPADDRRAAGMLPKDGGPLRNIGDAEFAFVLPASGFATSANCFKDPKK
jgi:hypothetical protein